MRRSRRDFLAWFVPPLALASCATTVDPAPDFARARELIESTTGVERAYDPEAPLLSAAEFDGVLANGLTLEEALSLALANNRRLQAGFLELGVGRADFVQAGLLANPTLGVSFLLPTGGGDPRIGASLLESVAEIWQLPRREAVASLAQDRRVLELSRFAGELLAQVRSAYHEVVSARQAFEVAERGQALAAEVRGLVQRRLELGAATRTDLGLAEADALDAALASVRISRAAAIGSQQLAALLSLERDLSAVDLTSALPSSAALAGLDADLAERALETRLDLRVARTGVALAEARVELERSRRYRGAAAGFEAERPEGDGSPALVGGVAASIELPIFDQNTAAIRRAEFERDALAKELEALSAEISAEVRAALERATAARATADFLERQALPKAEQNAALARRALELGDTTVLALLEAERSVLDARRALVEARLELARSQFALERAAGAPLAKLRGQP